MEWEKHWGVFERFSRGIHGPDGRYVFLPGNVWKGAEPDIDLFEQLPCMALMYDAEGRFLALNSRICETLGYRRTDLFRLRLSDVERDLDGTELRRRFELSRGYDFLSQESEYLRRDGTGMPVEVCSRLVEWEGETAALSTAWDLTKQAGLRKRLQRAETRCRSYERELEDLCERERGRLAQDLHDGLCPSLISAKMLSETIVEQMETAGPEERSVRALARIIAQGVEELREIIGALRSSVGCGWKLEEKMDRFLDAFAGRYPGIRVEKSVSLIRSDLPNPVKHSLYRVLQESLNNVGKHSGASRVRIVLESVREGVHLVIEDNGRGFDSEGAAARKDGSCGMGLAGIRDRVRGTGGVFSVTSVPGKGTVIRCRWPEEVCGRQEECGEAEARKSSPWAHAGAPERPEENGRFRPVLVDSEQSGVAFVD